MPGRRWTKKQRKEQAEVIRRSEPWLKSTGPRTPTGKARSSLNGLKHGTRSQAVAMFRAMDRQFRHGDQEDFTLLGEVEEARALVCQFVAKIAKPNDLMARMRAMEFVSIQTRKGGIRLEKKTEKLVRLAKGR